MRKNKPTAKGIVTLLLFITLATSCQKNTIYHSYQPVNATGWEKNDTLLFTLPQKLVNHSYQYAIGIRHDDSYKYRDLWLEINQDTIHVYLADITGDWTGKGFGNRKQLTLPIQLKPFSQDSIQEFRIHHIMQDNPLTGIHDIGIQIKKP